MRGEQGPAVDLQPQLRRLLQKVRRRIRARRLLAHAARLGPPTAALAAGLVLASRVTSAPWGEPLALAVGLAVAAGVLAAGLGAPVTLRRAALVADRGLGARDALVASLELGDRVDPVARAVRARARAVTAEAKPRRAAPLALRRTWRPLTITAVLTVVGVVAALVANPQDARRRQRAELRETLSATAAEIEALALATAAGSPDLPGDEVLAKELRELADAVQQAGDLDAAVATLERAGADLAAGLTADVLATKAAAAGLDREVQMLPLRGFGNPNDPEDAVAQFQKAARHTKGMTNEEMRVLANRLAALAEAQRLANPGVAQAMNDASAALRAGDRARADAALNRAAAKQGEVQGSVRSAEQRMAAAAALGQPTSSLQAEADRRAGRDQGADGGDGTGANAGSGRSQVYDNDEGGTTDAPGAVVGAQGGTGSGTSPAATVADRADETEIMFPELDFDERNAKSEGGGASGPGAQVSVSGAVGEPEEATPVVERQDTPTETGVARVPLSGRAASYQAQATAAMQRPDVPPAVRALVSRYFAGLGEQRD